MTGREVLEEIKDAIGHYEKNMGRKPDRIFISQAVWNVLWESYGRWYMKASEKLQRARTLYGIEVCVDPRLKGETHFLLGCELKEEGDNGQRDEHCRGDR